MQDKTNFVYLVRHGESEANTQGIYQGQTYNTQLSVLGQRQALALGKRLRKIPFDRIITSPLLRTQATATYVSSKVKLELRLLETNHGEWEGKSKNEIESTWPKIYSRWLNNPKDVTFPGGESFLETQSRVLSWWKEVANDPCNLLVVAHDNVLRIVIASVLRMDLDDIWQFHLQSAAITTIEIKNGKPKVICLNDTGHLAGLQADLLLHAL